MLTFFRRIRKALIESSQARKYILYAIGEIALVVIGILIALQINNWNEWRKDRILERSVLVSLQEELTSNIVMIEDYFEEQEKFRKAIIRLYHLFGENKETLNQIDDLALLIDSVYIRIEALQLNLTVYNETVNSDKLALITDTDCRASIAEWSIIVETAQNWQKVSESFQNKIFDYTLDIFPYKNVDSRYSYFKDWSSSRTKLDYDITKMFESLKFENLVNTQLLNLHQFEAYYINVKAHAEDILKLIQEELGE